MSVDSKIYLTSKTKKKDVFKILSAVQTAIDSILTSERIKNFENQPRPIIKDDQDNSFNCHIEMIPYCQSARVLFRLRGESRMLWMSFNADCDGVEITKKPYSTVFSIGHWGSYKEIMLSVSSELKKTFSKEKLVYIENDCSDTSAEILSKDKIKEKLESLFQ